MILKDAEAPGGERTKILDFGIAKLVEGVRGDQPKTQSQVVMGTPQYMSPEQCKGARHVDEKTDVYALGTILFEMLAGRTPFVAESAGEYIGMHLFRELPQLSSLAPSVPTEVAGFVDSLLIKDKAQRPDMAQVVTRLGQLLRGHGAPSHTSAEMYTLVNQAATPTVRLGASSTLGRSAGQLGRRALDKRLWLLGAGAALLLVGLVALAVRERGQPAKMAQPAVAASGQALPAAAEPASQKVPPPAPAPRTVSWSVRTTPSGAAVVDSDGKVLGQTPWRQTAEAAVGMRTLSLRLAGYAEQTLTLDRSADADRQERLRRLPSGSGSRAAQKSSSAQKPAPAQKIPDSIDYEE